MKAMRTMAFHFSSLPGFPGLRGGHCPPLFFLALRILRISQLQLAAHRVIRDGCVQRGDVATLARGTPFQARDISPLFCAVPFAPN